MSDPVSGNAEVEYIRSLFEQEKLHYELGWRSSKVPITLASLGVMVTEIYGGSAEPVREGAKISA
jgi:hypothetical protein